MDQTQVSGLPESLRVVLQRPAVATTTPGTAGTAPTSAIDEPDQDGDIFEPVAEVRSAIVSWERTLSTASVDVRRHTFKEACGELLRLADSYDEATRLHIIDRLLEFGRLQELSDDESQAIMAGSCRAPSVAPSESAGVNAARTAPTARQPLLATNYIWKGPSSMPSRSWLYGRLLLRKFVSATIAPGGVGKSSLVVTEALAMVSGKPLLDEASEQNLRVWLWNLEDPQEETARKIQAAAIRYQLEPDDIGDRLFVDSGREQRLVIAETTKAGTAIVRPVVDDLIAEISRLKIDVVVIDPFVSSHSVPENDNGAVDLVVKEWAKVADQCDCSVHLIHHSRKQGADAEINTESARGGKAFSDACRVVRALNRMTQDEAAKAGVENHRLFFRAYNDKANASPPADKSDWFKLESISLGNGPHGSPGDSVGVVTPWKWPDALAGVTDTDFAKAAAKIKAGRWRADFRAKAWVGKPIAEAMGLNLGKKADIAKTKAVLKSWLERGLLVEVEGQDERRETRTFVEVADDD